MKRPAQSAIVVAVTLSLLATACGGSDDPLELGLRRVSLDLAFKDADKAPPADPQSVRTVIEYFDSEITAVEEPEPEAPPPVLRRIPRVAPAPACIAAEPGTTPDEPVYGVVEDPPKVGTYRRRNTGTIKVETTAFPAFELQYPPLTTWEITDVTLGTGPIVVNPHDDPGGAGRAVPEVPRPDPAVPRADAAPTSVSFKLTRSVSRDLKTIDTYMYFGDRGRADLEGDNTSTDLDGDGLYLIRRETTSARFGTTVFTPTPPVLVVPIGDESKTHEVVVSAGIDRQTNAAMTVSSRVLGREDVDVCGTVLSTYRVEWEEQLLDLSQTPPAVSGNLESGKKNVWHMAFDRNLLLVQEEMHTVQHRSFQFAGARVPLTVTMDYTSTLMNVEPEPLGEQS